MPAQIQPQPPLLDEPVQALLDELSSGASRTMVAMVGLPGAGKSTLAEQMGEAVNRAAGPATMAVLGMDGFHLTKAQLRALPHSEEAFRRRGAPWTFDAAALADRLRQVRAAIGRESVCWPDFQHGVGDPVEDVHEIQPATRLILVEGLYLLHDADGWDEVRDQFDAFWYLDTPFDVAMERLAKRHLSAWKGTREEVERRIASNDRLNAEIVLQTRDRADWRLLSK